MKRPPEMPNPLYMDVHIPASVTGGLRRRGIDVLTSQDDGTREATDESLLERSSSLGRVLVTQDADLLRIAAEWQSDGRKFPGVIYAHQQGIGIGPLIEDLELLSRYADSSELVD